MDQPVTRFPVYRALNTRLLVGRSDRRWFIFACFMWVAFYGGTNSFVLATTVFFIGQTIALIVGYSDPQFLLFVFDASHRKVNYDPGKV